MTPRAVVRSMPLKTPEARTVNTLLHKKVRQAHGLLVLSAAALLAFCAPAVPVATADESSESIVLVVMDPLAKPLSCPCVQGYAQRDYAKLAERLEQDLGRPVTVVFNDSLKSALDGDAQGQADIVIGKRSVVLYDATRTKRDLLSVAALSNKEGGTTMTGLVVVASTDAAQSVSQLAGYRLVFGPEECDEKHAAALTLFRQHGITPPATLETAVACDEGALAILEDAQQNRHGAAVISSYAAPLLEGCGTVAKGALRVVGKTEPVPFIEVFVRADLPESDRNKIVDSLLVKSKSDPLLRLALESRDGFVPVGTEAVAAAKKK